MDVYKGNGPKDKRQLEQWAVYYSRHGENDFAKRLVQNNAKRLGIDEHELINRIEVEQKRRQPKPTKVVNMEVKPNTQENKQ